MDPMSNTATSAGALKMREAGQPEEAIRSFEAAIEQVQRGDPTLLPSAELEPARHGLTVVTGANGAPITFTTSQITNIK